MIDSYDKLTIKKYRELVSLENTDDMEYSVDILSILCDIAPEELMEMPLDEFTKLMGKAKFLNKPIDRKDYKDIGKKLTVNGKEYTVVRNARDLTAGQYIDYKAYTSRDNFLEMLPYILTVFLIPSGKKYNNGYDVAELAEEFDNHMGLQTALAISDFFLHQSEVLIQSSLLCLKWKMKRMMRKEKNKETKDKIQECMEQMESLRSLLKTSAGSIQQ